jgi:hypothetical protein
MCITNCSNNVQDARLPINAQPLPIINGYGPPTDMEMAHMQQQQQQQNAIMPNVHGNQSRINKVKMRV